MRQSRCTCNVKELPAHVLYLTAENSFDLHSDGGVDIQLMSETLVCLDVCRFALVAVLYELNSVDLISVLKESVNFTAPSYAKLLITEWHSVKILYTELHQIRS